MCPPVCSEPSLIKVSTDTHNKINNDYFFTNDLAHKCSTNWATQTIFSLALLLCVVKSASAAEDGIFSWPTNHWQTRVKLISVLAKWYMAEYCSRTSIGRKLAHYTYGWIQFLPWTLFTLLVLLLVNIAKVLH